MLVALILVSTGMVLSVFAGDVIQLMAYRVLAGLGIGGMIANLNVFVSEYSSDKRRGSIFGLFTSGFAIGATLGGFIAGGPLIPHFGWRSVFAVGAAASIIMLAVTWRFLPESLEYLVSKRPPNALARVNAFSCKCGGRPWPNSLSYLWNSRCSAESETFSRGEWPSSRSCCGQVTG